MSEALSGLKTVVRQHPERNVPDRAQGFLEQGHVAYAAEYCIREQRKSYRKSPA